MILPLRRAHRASFLALALLLPALLASAWKVRRAPAVQELPPDLLPGLAPEPGAASSGADLLVYWCAAPVHGDTALPADATLVGTLRSGALLVPPPPGKEVLLYDLAKGRLSGGEGE